MSAYLETTDGDYAPNTTLTTALITRASAIIDGYCNRSLGVTSYTERVPLTPEQRGHLSYYPVTNVTALKGRAYSGHYPFGGPPPFDDLDVDTLDVDKEIGAIWCGASAFASSYVELEVTYKSGFAIIPDKVKVACGLICEKLANNVNPNIKSKKDFDFSIEYFGVGIVTSEISELLNEYRMKSFR